MGLPSVSRSKFILAAIAACVLAAARPCQATSLWNARTGSASLFTDHRARSVDDILTVVISESSSATRTATTTTGRETTVDGKVEQWFTVKGLKNAILGIVGLGDEKGTGTKTADTANLPQWKLSTKNDFTGTGTTLRNDGLTAKIACRVIEVLPNQNLVIEGKQSVTVNAEEQLIVLRGTVRPEDVSTANIVYSYNIVDAKITYYGKGPLGDKQKRGVFQMLGDIIWPL